MLSSAPVCATLPTINLAEAKKFYSDILGLKLVDDMHGGGLLYEAGKGSMLMLFESDSKKSEDTAANFEVDDLDAEMAELRRKGVLFEEYDLPGIKTVNGVADMDGDRAAWFKDPSGNILALHENK